MPDLGRRIALVDPYAGKGNDFILEQISRAENQARPRRDVLKEWRDERYGRTNVIDMIPPNLRATAYEYHSPAINDNINLLTSFLSQGQMIMRAGAPTDKQRTAADEEEEVLQEIFRPGGQLDAESPGRIRYKAWGQQVENGDGVYKLMEKRDYPLAIPQRIFSDDESAATWANMTPVDNPRYTGKDRRAGREALGTTRYMETNRSLDERRSMFFDSEFPWMWRAPDPITMIRVTQDGINILEGEITIRAANVLDEHGLGDLKRNDAGYTYFLEEPHEKGSALQSRSPVVATFEIWSRTRGWFGFLSHSLQDNGQRELKLSLNEEFATWNHDYERTPYYHAFGFPSTDDNPAYEWAGVFESLIAEVKLLNYLETMVFNAAHRHIFPEYQLTRLAGAADAQPLTAEQKQITSYDEAQTRDPPPGYEWQPIPAGLEPDVAMQLQSARDRVKDQAISQVLTGRSDGGANDSGAKISLLTNAAQRSIDPLVEGHELPYSQMATVMIRSSKRKKTPLSVTTKSKRPDGNFIVRALTLTPARMVSDHIEATFNIALPVDAAAMETRGMALMREGRLSFRTAGPKYLDIGDPDAEMDRIDFEKRVPQMDELAFREAVRVWAGLMLEADIAAFLNSMPQPENPAGGVGGGPDGAFGGAAQQLGAGNQSLAGTPGSAQIVSPATAGGV